MTVSLEAEHEPTVASEHGSDPGIRWKSPASPGPFPA
jgi:hypothetical protein